MRLTVRWVRVLMVLLVATMLCMGMIGHAQATNKCKKNCARTTMTGPNPQPKVKPTQSAPGNKNPAPRVTIRVTKKVPGPTVTVRPPARTVTKTVTATPTPTPTIIPSATLSPSAPKERIVEVTVNKAVGISLGLVVVGALLALFILYLMYVFGYLRAEEKNVEDLKSLKQSIDK